ncbi:MAG: phosphoribosylformylglycinamidine synthase subunit PurS [Candidatus Celaenobacter antarcticus]|nr:phosphoribosylformylglycinamidine synthase subunit PurS [Candidatus Celaenobacter antarcticus]MDP8314775.1 phosphoribosylformylglycinamidine synthase subunit PurS [Candidatus Celaenobacter antarcticus]
MRKATIYVTLKPQVLDPQGKVIMNALHTLGYNNVTEVRASKMFEVSIDAKKNADISKEIDEICDKVLANPNIETYRYDIHNE